MASHRFGDAEADNIFSSFDDDEERECIVKECLNYHCERAGLVCVVQKEREVSFEKCHVAPVEDSDVMARRGVGCTVACLSARRCMRILRVKAWSPCLQPSELAPGGVC
jgi:hypothetical protein